MTKRGNRLRLESLETRLTPAGSLSLTAGNLRVFGDNLNNEIVLTRTGSVVNVRIDNTNFGNYAVTGGITVFGSNGNDTIELRLADDFNGPVTIDGGLGADEIIISNQGTGVARPRVQGLTTLIGGFGDDFIRIGEGGAVGLTNLNVRGDFGYDSLRIDRAEINGYVIASTTNSVVIGAGDGESTTQVIIAGPTIITNGGEAFGDFFFLTGDSILGSLVLTTGGGGDVADIFRGTILGDATVVQGAGNNSLTLQRASVVGSLTGVTLNGADFVDFSIETLIGGSVNLNLGDGNNEVTANGGAFVNGSFELRTGNGNDYVGGFLRLFPFEPNIAGRLNVNLGNGNNEFDFNGTLAGPLSYHGGGGEDRVRIAGAHAFALTVRLGAGADIFTFAANTTVASALLDFGAGADAYNDGGNVIAWPMTIIGL
jgi:hypothetical protein